MGVQGLWKLLEPAGRTVALETLQGKVLAVDVSIWLHQALYGMRDSDGQAVTNAHLLVLFNRLCKLLYYGVKPIFVFDGTTPTLKLKTLTARQQRRFMAGKQSQKVAEKLLKNYMKSAVLGSAPTVPHPLLGGEEVKDDLFVLPPLPQEEQSEPISLVDVDHRSEEEEVEEDISLAPLVKDFYQDLSSLDIDSPSFTALPPEIQHELISEKQQHDKEIKFRHLKEVPEEAGSFSSFQLNRLMSRNQLSRKLDDLRRMMVSSYSADVGEGGRGEREVETRRIVSKAGSHYVLVHNTPSQSESEEEWESDSRASSTGNVEVKGERSGINSEVKPGEDQSVGDAGLVEEELAGKEAAHTLLMMGENQVEKGMQGTVHEGVEMLGQLENAAGGNVEVVDDDGDIQRAIYASFQIVDRSQSSSAQQMMKGYVPARPAVVDGSLQEVEGAVERCVSERVDVVEDSTVADGSDGANVGERDSRSPPLQAEGERVTPPPQEEGDSSSGGPHSNAPPEGQDPLCIDLTSTTGSGVVHDIDVVCAQQGEGDGEREEVGVMSGSSSSSEEEEEEEDGEPLKKRQKVDDVLDEDSLVQPTAEHTALVEVEEARNEMDEDQQMDDDQRQFISDFGEVGQEVLSQQLQSQRQQLLEEGGRMARYASEVNSQVYKEAQDLLRLFGVPFITSPSEAESQCAWLDVHHPQVDGTITDDNDYLLFGGQHVYRHFFNQNRIAELYTNSDIQQCLGLSQDQLILLAYFTGSDYTEGVQGVGVVTAVEVLRDFPGKGLEVLQKFRAWYEEGSQLSAADKRLTGRQRKLLQVSLPPSFPDEQVMKAYLYPVVDDSTEHFSWTTPDMYDLQQYAVSRLGWSEKKAKETLAPVFKRMNETKPSTLQSKLSSYFNVPHFVWEERPIASKRVQQAVTRLKAAAREGKEEDGTTPTSCGGGGAAGSTLRLSESSSSEGEGTSGDMVRDKATLATPQRQGRGRGRGKGSGRGSNRGRGRGNNRGRGRGSSRGRGRGSSRGRGKKQDLISIIPLQEEGTTSDQEWDVEKSEHVQ